MTDSVRRPSFARAQAGAAIAAAFAVAAACHGGSATGGRAPAEPAPPGVLPRTVLGVTVEPASGQPPALDEGMPRLTPVLEDPRLAGARDREAAGDGAGAAREIERVLGTAVPPQAQACAWSYLAGRLHLAAGEPAEAAAAFLAATGLRSVTAADGLVGGRSAADSGAVACSATSAAASAATATTVVASVAGPTACPLASYARLREAEALVRSSRYDEALAALNDLDANVPEDEVKLTSADAYVGKGDRYAAVTAWRSLLASSPHGNRWVDTAIQLAKALLDGVDGPPESRAQEALDLATRVVVEAPAVADKLDAGGLRERAAAAAKKRVPPLTVEERVRQAQALLDAAQPRRAHDVADGILRAVPSGGKEHVVAACRAAIQRAQSLPRGKADQAADAWGNAIARCRDDDSLVTALYQGARASASAKRRTEALARFAEVERRFPKHRLADDARFRAALILEDQGDLGRALTMLESIADVYPDGDMGGDALFRVALEKLARHDLDGAKAPLDRLLAVPPESLGWGSECRAEYFRARLAQLSGDAADAQARYAAIVTNRPLSYYMLLAYARLRALDDGAARATLEAAVRREPAGPFLDRPHPELQSPAFERFVRLLEVGEIDAARRDAIVGGFVSESAEPDVVWTVAWLYERAGAPELGHAFSRARLVDYRTHWPAGRWRLAWEVAFPRVWNATVLRESDGSRVPPPLTWAIMREESAFDPDARSIANAQGLMQLMPGTARLVAQGTSIPADEDALHRPDVSIALGARLLSSLRTTFADRPALAIAAYNGGTVAVRRWLAEHSGDDFDIFVERIPFDETRNYLKRVLASQSAYAYLYAPAALDELVTLFP
jgi:soluble lytic murein transglycosylase